MKQFSIGFVGCGFAADLHISAYKRVPGFDIRLHAVHSVDFDAAKVFAEKNDITQVYEHLEDLLADPAIDIIDIVTPPATHIGLIKQAMASGKHVIVEKPLNGFFGSADTPGAEMYDHVCRELKDLEEFLEGRTEQLFYAENYIYAPSIQKIAEMIEASGEKLLLMKGDESHNGSHAPHAALWSQNGGGSLIRQGCHPLSAVLYLKEKEAKRRNEKIEVASVLCDASYVAKNLPEEERGAILSRPVDVEDWAETIITFTDGTKAVVSSGDMIVGGVRNVVEAYTPNACYVANIAPNDALVAHHVDPSSIKDVYITEKLSTKAGWQYVFVSEEEMRGYVGEMEDFLTCLVTGEEPQSSVSLAFEAMRVLYASYASASMHKRFVLE